MDPARSVATRWIRNAEDSNGEFKVTTSGMLSRVSRETSQAGPFLRAIKNADVLLELAPSLVACTFVNLGTYYLDPSGP